jgi:hypothetical protein
MYLSVSTAARAIDIAVWQLRVLFLRGLVDEPARLGHSRIIKPDDLPTLRRAALAAGYLKGGDQ